jgi:glyoxylase-like metal-dependent hydrolase (beta-lactamase superfamily II)
MAKTNAPAFHRFMFGAYEITVLSDGTIDLPVDQLLKEPPQQTQDALRKSFLKTPLETSVNAFLINTGERLVLVDAGAGTLFGPTLGKLADNLRASGYKPENVDDVLLTHMHPDHVGGLVVNGAVQFPNATIHATEKEAGFWLSQKNLDAAPAESKSFFQGAMASLNPYVLSKRLALFEGNVEVVPGITALASPGHTVGHTSYVVRSQGQELILVGDLIHVPAVQLAHPRVTIAFDTDGTAAALIARESVHGCGKLRRTGGLLTYFVSGHRAFGASRQRISVGPRQLHPNPLIRVAPRPTRVIDWSPYYRATVLEWGRSSPSIKNPVI